MNKVAKEIVLFLLFSYLAVWLGFLVVTFLDIKSGDETLNYVDEVLLTQLFFFIWIISLIFLYIIRLLTLFLIKKFD